MGTPTGFTYRVQNDGSVAITHQGKVAAFLRGAKAAKFLAGTDSTEPAGLQSTMARLTGNYKRGNERGASKHNRNQ